MSIKLDNNLRNLRQVELTNIKHLLNSTPTYPIKGSIQQYEKQLVETRTMLYHKQTRRILHEEDIKDPEARRLFVITRVARELWTNFCVRGQDTPMLRHLHEELCKCFNTKYQFLYLPGSIELVITKEEKNKTVNVDREEHLAIVNKAWEVCQQVVANYIL